jgi:hypothetical protein
MDLSDDEGELNPRTESNNRGRYTRACSGSSVSFERSVSCPQATDDDDQPRVSE